MGSQPSNPSRKPRVLIAHRYFWPTDLSQFPEMLREIAEWHSKRGHEVTVLTSVASKPEYQARRTVWAQTAGVRLEEIDLPIDRGRGVIQRVGAMLSFKRFIDRAVERVRPDLMLCTSCPSLLSGWSARRAKRRQGSRYLYYVQDILPELLISRGGLSLLAGRWLAYLDRRIVSESEATITISEEMRSTLLSRNAAGGTVRVIPNYAIDAGSGVSRRASPPPPTLVFAGNFGKLQAIDHFLRAAHLASCKCDFNVRMVGGGSESDRLIRLANKLGMKNIEFHGVVSRDAAQEIISSADLGVVSAQEGLYDIAFPSKIYSYLLSGLPALVFANEKASVAGWIEKNQLGGVVSATEVHAAALGIERLVQQVTRGGFENDRIARFTADELSKDRYFEAYARVVDGVIGGSGVPSRMVA